MKRIAVFIEQSGIDHNASVIHFLEFLSDHFAIDLFLRRVWRRKADVLNKKTIRLVEIRKKPTGRELWEQTKGLVKSALHPGSRGSGPRDLPGMDGIRSREAGTRFPADRYECLVAFDPHGLLLCKEIFPRARPFYYSLELYLRGDKANPFHSPAVRRQLKKAVCRQRELLADIRGLIIQSREREALFREDFRLRPELPSLLLPVTGRGGSIRKKLDGIREKYGVPPQTKIALHLGGIYGWYSCIELAQAFSRIPGWVLVFQGLANRDYLKRMRSVLEGEAIRNTIISGDFYERMADLDPILMSADIGVAWYNDISPNFTTSGRSSGKISSYLRFGLPVIVNRYPSTEEIIAARGCGVCIDDFSQIGPALERIEREYGRFASRCHDTYDDIFNFENYQQALLRFISEQR